MRCSNVLWAYVTLAVVKLLNFLWFFQPLLFIFIREFLLNLILFNIFGLFVEIGNALALADNQVSHDHRRLICKDGEFVKYNIDGIIAWSYVTPWLRFIFPQS